MDAISYILAKKYVDSKIASIETGSTASDKQIVEKLPEKGEEGIIYLVPSDDGRYSEYVWKNDSFVKIKETEVNSIVSDGYFYKGKFYDDEDHTTESKNNLENIYVDKASGKLYYYNTKSKQYEQIILDASESVSGVVKMYDSEGNNIDGTMTQKAIKDTIDNKLNSAFENIVLLDGGSAK